MSPLGSIAAVFSRGWNRYWFSLEPVIGMALFRIAFGLSVAVFHLPRFPYIRELYTAEGFMVSLPWVSWLPAISPPGVPLAYALNIGLLTAAAALTVGYRTRLAALATAVLHTYLMLVEYLVADSLAQIISIFALLLACSPAGLFYSLDAYRVFGSFAPEPMPRTHRALRLVMVWQLAAIYLSNAMMKIALGFRQWISGDMALRVFQGTEWGQPWVWPLAQHVQGPLRIAGAAAFIGFLGLGVGLLFSRTRPYAAAFGLLWHFATFALTIISPGWLALVSVYLLLVEPTAWERYWALLARGRLPARSLAAAGIFVILFILTATYGRSHL